MYLTSLCPSGTPPTRFTIQSVSKPATKLLAWPPMKRSKIIRIHEWNLKRKQNTSKFSSKLKVKMTVRPQRITPSWILDKDWITVRHILTETARAFWTTNPLTFGRKAEGRGTCGNRTGSLRHSFGAGALSVKGKNTKTLYNFVRHW